MTTIKIHDTEWFKENCCPSTECPFHTSLRPKGDMWESLDKEAVVAHWIVGGDFIYNNG